MKNTILAGSTLLLLSLSTLSVEAAPNTKFYCGQYQGKPATLARTSRGDIPIVIWQSEAFAASGFTAQRRCNIVSNKFQQFNASGSLQFLTTGTINNHGVLCAVPTQTRCQASDILLTLEPGENPEQILADLLKVRDGASGPITRGNTWIDMDEFLRYAPTVEGNTSAPAARENTISAPAPVAPQTPSQTPPTPLW
jgi:hypothetical protein